MSADLNFVSFTRSGRKGFGVVKGDGIVDLAGRHGNVFPSLRDVIAAGKILALRDESARTSPDFALAGVTLDIPVTNPEKIICVGVNYPDRNEEYKDNQAAPSNPSLFVRFPRSFVGHGASVVRPQVSHQLDYEGEVVIVIGHGGRHIREADALSHIAGLSLANEGTLRDWVRHAKFNVTQGKNFDSSGSIGPWFVPYTDEDQIADIQLATRVNGEVRQQDRTSRMVFSFREIIAYISTFTTLVPGDVILTGTPTGAGARFDPPRWLLPGDVIEVEADGLGSLRNTVVDEAEQM